MKTAFQPLLYIAIAQLFIVNISNAQSSKTGVATLQVPPANLVIDGNAKEWGDSLRYYNAEKKINYSLANDQENLYMAIKITDRLNQMKILRAGITFSIDTKGKKKETYSLTFPLNVNGNQPPPVEKMDNGDVTKEDRDELMREQITTLRGIKVAGFKDIEDDMITTSNTYGIKTAINYDDNGNLIYEAAIPLKFFNAGDITKNEWAFNFKINGVQRPAAKKDDDAQGQGGGGGRGGHGGGGGFGGGGGGFGGGGGRGGHGGNRGGGPSGGDGKDEMSKSTDFWEKFYLSK